MLVGLVYKSVWIVVPSRMAVISRKFARSSEHSVVNFIVGWKRLISCRNCLVGGTATSQYVVCWPPSGFAGLLDVLCSHKPEDVFQAGLI